MIPYGRQSISQDDIDAVVEILHSDFLTQGPTILTFEEALATYCGAKYAVAVSSATAALHLSCLALKITSKDTVWTSPNTFVASANCALYCGAKVDFVDIDPLSYNMDSIELEKKLITAEKRGTLPSVVIPVHFAGQSCEMKEIHLLAQRFGFRIIEDASHAVGATYLDKPVGSCQYSDMTVFSFHPVKIMTTAEGGVITTNDKNLYDLLMILRTHGITRNQEQMISASDGPWYYQQIMLGYNYRMTDIQAALGLSQLKKIESFLEKRQDRVRRYNRDLAGLPLTLPYASPTGLSAHHLYPVRLNLEKIKKSKKEIFHTFLDKGIGVNLHYIPVHLHPYYAEFGFKRGDFPKAEKYYTEAMSIPLHPTLTPSQQDFIVSTLRETLK